MYSVDVVREPAQNDELASFTSRVQNAQRAVPLRALKAGLNLVDGALRIRAGGDGIYGEPHRPVTKPAEALRAWLRSMEPDIRNGTFDRHNELREAIVAAGEEINRAVEHVPAATRLRSALYSDATNIIGGWETPKSIVPWIVAASLGGVVVGMLLTRKNHKRRKR